MTYLMQTLDSIIAQTSKTDKQSVVAVVFLADLDQNYNNETAYEIVKKYPKLIKSGFLQIIRVSKDYYPPLKNLKRNFNDAPDRVSWRAKQVADFALMFAYAQNISEYYLQIEDDVVCAKHFVIGIKQYIDMRTRAGLWTMLEFSELGFIGKLFKSSDLDLLSRYMKMFYEEQPVDWLMSYFRLSMGQRVVYLRKPTLFQHFGLKSSFDITKDNKLVDKFFEIG